MADGTDERNNRPPSRGSRLRYMGSKPKTVGQCSESVTPEYSDGMDYSIGGTTLNANPPFDKGQRNPTKASNELRGKTGLIIKEPLS